VFPSAFILSLTVFFFSGRYKKNLEPTPAGADRTDLTILKVPHVISLQGLSIPLFFSPHSE
jgi:hypothetical protein